MPAALPGDTSRRQARWVAAALLGVLLTVQLGQGIRVARLPALQLVAWNVVIDDGFYYLQVARNLARGHGSTFDRVNRTNGYQPLWALALVPIFWFTDDAVTGLHAALILATLLGGLALVLLYYGLARLCGLGAALLACALVVANPYYLQLLQGGLETPALFVGLAGLLAYWAWRGEQVLRGARRACLGLGTILGLIVLARTDVALALAPLGLVLVAVGPGTLAARLRRAVWIALPAALLLLPFVAWSWLTQGSPVPVSGLVKRWAAETYTPTRDLWLQTEQWRGLTRTVQLLAFPWTMPEPDGPGLVMPRLRIPIALVVLLGLRLLWSRRARENRLAVLLFATSLVGALGHALYLFFLYRSTGHWNYHYFFPIALLYTVVLAIAAPLVAADLGLLLDRLLGGRLRPGLAALGAALCLPGVLWLLHRGRPDYEARLRELSRPAAQSFRKSRWDLADYMRMHYPPEEVFGSWWAGTLGYLSDRRVVNLDGVINSAEFFRRYLRTETVPRYIVEGPIAHLVDFFWRDPMGPEPPAWRAFWWEHEKEHIVRRLRRDLRLAYRVPYLTAGAGMYVLDVRKAPRPR